MLPWPTFAVPSGPAIVVLLGPTFIVPSGPAAVVPRGPAVAVPRGPEAVAVPKTETAVPRGPATTPARGHRQARRSFDLRIIHSPEFRSLRR